jgi:hypothetical protein
VDHLVIDDHVAGYLQDLVRIVISSGKHSRG